MKRDIKFKFWLGHTKKMTYEHSLIEISHVAWDFTEDIIALQFTGMVDKNGKEIYEGDIVKWGYPHDEFESEPQVTVIKYEIDGSKPICGFLMPLTQYGVIPQMEVIGNIYQNPELLESVQK